MFGIDSGYVIKNSLQQNEIHIKFRYFNPILDQRYGSQ